MFIFIHDLTPGYNGLGKYNCNMCKTRWESFKFCDLVWLILEIYNNFLSSQVVSLLLETGKCSVQTCIKWGQSVLHDAAKWGHTECLRMLLDAGANPDATDRWTNTPLMYATLHGHQECVGWLSIRIISFIFCPDYMYINYTNPGYGLSLVDTLWNAGSYRQPLEQEGNPMT